jgi:serine/threonine protein kinase
MKLNPGEKLGPYEILTRIGEGGMGQVWKARDTRLDRIVAIKTSHARFSERFEREARAVAALNHPHICTLYDVGPNYLVMEYVEGAEIKGPQPLDQTLKYAIQLAGALEAAHRKGITHRDLKPANIMITKAGVKVLDFGLARFETAKSDPLSDETVTRALTQDGAIVGTLQYMAPEQLQAKITDVRADIFSFGCVLYEMLTGRRAFDGANTASVIAAILERPAPSVAEVAPSSLDWALRLCLAKDPDERWQSVRDLRAALERTAEAVPEVPAEKLRKSRFPVVAWAAAGVLALVSASLAFIHFRETPLIEPVANTSIAFPENAVPGWLAFSPDSRRLIVRLSADGLPKLYLRSMDSPQLRLLANTDHARSPFWSPDGRSIGFFADGKLKTISAGGGPSQDLCSVSVESGGAWNANGVILFGANTGPLMRVNASGGDCTPVANGDQTGKYRFPVFLPDGKHFLYLFSGADASKSGVYLASLDEPKGNRLMPEGAGVIYAPPVVGSRYGHLLFLRDRTLMAQPFDGGKLQLAGDPFVVAEQTSSSPDNRTPAVSVAANGMLALVSQPSQEGQLVWFDRTSGTLAKVAKPGNILAPSLAPDGKTMAYIGGTTSRISILLRDLSRDSEVRLADGVNTSGLAWSPDGRFIVHETGNDIFRIAAAGGGADTLVLHTDNPKFASDWSRDGRFLIYTEVDPKTLGDIWYLENPLVPNGGTPVRFLGTEAMETQAQFSPDGRWVAYMTDESGGSVYVRPFPSGQGQWKVSQNAGTDPRWSPDGKQIFFRTGSSGPATIWAADFRPGRAGAPEIGVPRKLFDYRGVLSQRERNAFSYSVAPDGRFLVNTFADNSPPTIQLISNWLKFAAGGKSQ